MRHALDNGDLLVDGLDFVEDPLGLFEWAHLVFIARHDCQRHSFDVLDWHICRQLHLLVFREVSAVLLEALLHAILQKVEQSLLGEEFRLPMNVLLAPSRSQIRADHAADFVPVFTSQDLETQVACHRLNLPHESHAGLGSLDIHFRARSNKNDPANILQKLAFLLC